MIQTSATGLVLHLRWCLFNYFCLCLGGSNGDPGFRDFIYDSIVPACFLAPIKPTFDLNDAQTFLVSVLCCLPACLFACLLACLFVCLFVCLMLFVYIVLCVARFDWLFKLGISDTEVNNWVSIYQTNEYPFSRTLIGYSSSGYPLICKTKLYVGTWLVTFPAEFWQNKIRVLCFVFLSLAIHRFGIY